MLAMLSALRGLGMAWDSYVWHAMVCPTTRSPCSRGRACVLDGNSVTGHSLLEISMTSRLGTGSSFT